MALKNKLDRKILFVGAGLVVGGLATGLVMNHYAKKNEASLIEAHDLAMGVKNFEVETHKNLASGFEKKLKDASLDLNKSQADLARARFDIGKLETYVSSLERNISSLRVDLNRSFYFNDSVMGVLDVVSAQRDSLFALADARSDSLALLRANNVSLSDSLNRVVQDFGYVLSDLQRFQGYAHGMTMNRRFVPERRRDRFEIPLYLKNELPQTRKDHRSFRKEVKSYNR